VVEGHRAVVEAALPFVDEGLRAGDLTVLTCRPGTGEAIAAELGERAGGLASDARITLVGTRAPDALAVTRKLIDRARGTGSGRLRILAEVRFEGTARDRREGERYEAAANAVLAGQPLTALCLYDRSDLPRGMVESVHATHPLLLEGGAVRANPDVCDPRDFVRSLPVPREPVETAPPVLVVDDAPTLPALRHALAAVVDRFAPDPEQREDLRLGLAEVAANAFRHGSRPVSARAWCDGRLLVCTVTDRGSRFDDPLAGFVPAHGDDLGLGGMGLWLARKLFDSVDLLAGPHGFSVRLATALR
jgi:anti-sigma regulatory factor (Ser/Thr protein kinase)